MKGRTQARLRLAFSDGVAVEPRRYAQSTSGRRASQRTTPPLSRSSLMTVDSAIRCLAETALRRYPTDVPQRSAKASWATRSRDLRYVSSDSIGRVLPNSNVSAIPFVHFHFGGDEYDDGMLVQDIRRRRLRQLMDREFDGKQQLIADHIGVEQNYISGLLGQGKTRKPFGEKAARKIEKGCGKPPGWLDQDPDVAADEPVTAWPFNLDPMLWDRLPAHQKRDIEAAFTKMVLGASVEQAASPGHKRRA